MSVEKGLGPISFPASGDLSSKQYFPVNLASDGEVQVAPAGAWVLGVLQNDPAAVGREASVETKAGAVTKVVVSTTANAAISVGSALKSGAGVKGAILASTGGTAHVFARALEAVSTGQNRIISAVLTHEGPTSTA